MQPDLTALLGSRICHDLISPLGAIGNGVELLTLADAAQGPEIALISESVHNANARIRFFRIAYGASSDGQRVARGEITSILADLYGAARLDIDWRAAGDPPRDEVKLLFLLIQCLETALPFGGQVTADRIDGVWTLAGTSPKLRAEPALWDGFRSAAARPGSTPPEAWAGAITSALVHFALVPDSLRKIGATLAIEMDETTITLRF
jgi:histidine phosphotransferase ChpT